MPPALEAATGKESDDYADYSALLWANIIVLTLALIFQVVFNCFLCGTVGSMDRRLLEMAELLESRADSPRPVVLCSAGSALRQLLNSQQRSTPPRNCSRG